MLKIFKIVFALLIIYLSFSGTAMADEKLTFNYLIENGKSFDKKEVKIRGEAIGEPLKRGSYTWINISDGTVPFGIWMRNEDAEKVRVFGDYHKRGDTVEVTGTFYRACSEHGGDMDIHAGRVNIIKEGGEINHPLNYGRLGISIGLTVVTLILGLYYLKKYKSIK